MFDLKTNVLSQNHNFGGFMSLFDISFSLIAENSLEILNLSTMMYDFSPLMRMTLCLDQTIKVAKAKVSILIQSCVWGGQFEGAVLVSMFDLDWTKKGNSDVSRMPEK